MFVNLINLTMTLHVHVPSVREPCTCSALFVNLILYLSTSYPVCQLNASACARAVSLAAAERLWVEDTTPDEGT